MHYLARPIAYDVPFICWCRLVDVYLDQNVAKMTGNVINAETKDWDLHNIDGVVLDRHNQIIKSST